MSLSRSFRGLHSFSGRLQFFHPPLHLAEAVKAFTSLIRGQAELDRTNGWAGLPRRKQQQRVAIGLPGPGRLAVGKVGKQLTDHLSGSKVALQVRGVRLRDAATARRTP